MPRRDLCSQARFRLQQGELRVSPAWCLKAYEAARKVLNKANLGAFGGELTLTTNIPLDVEVEALRLM